MIRRLLSALIADDPNPQPSRLDRLDHQGWPIAPHCAVIACPNPPTTSIHGWSLCAEHRSAYAAR